MKREYMLQPQAVQFGVPENWDQFNRKFKPFILGLPSLQEAANVILARTLRSDRLEDNAIFGLGQLCTEDFQEILLLCGNGYGTGAIKILRGMFERTVDAHYLSKHPEEAKAFFDFADVDLSKLFRSAEEHFGDGLIPRERLAEVQELKARAKAFENPSGWTKRNVVDRAKDVGLGPDTPSGWYTPMPEIHSSARAILRRQFALNESRRWEIVEEALFNAHGLFLRMLHLQLAHFNFGNEDGILGICYKDFENAWADIAKRFKEDTTKGKELPKAQPGQVEQERNKEVS